MIHFDSEGSKYRLVVKHENSTGDEFLDEGQFYPRGSKARHEIYRYLDKRDSPRARTIVRLEALIVMGEGTSWQKILSGEAKCSWWDQFNKKTGIALAIENLKKKLLAGPHANHKLLGDLYVAYANRGR